MSSTSYSLSPPRAGIRAASFLDIAELGRLAASAAHKVAGYLSGGYLLVLDRGDGHLDAACHIVMREDSSSIDLLVVDPRIHDSSIELRMLSVAHALCEAYGCQLRAEGRTAVLR